MIELLLIPVVAILGVLAGGAVGSLGKFLSRVAIGLCFGWVMFGHHWYIINNILIPFPDPSVFVIAGVMWLGQTFGHGQPVGYAIHLFNYGSITRHLYDSKGEHGELEKWQPEFLRHSPYLSITLRGILTFHPSMIIANPLAMVLGLLTPTLPHMNKWRNWEMYRFSIGLLLTEIATCLLSIK